MLNNASNLKEVKEALHALSDWSGSVVLSSYEATIYHEWMDKISSKLYGPILKQLPKWGKPLYNSAYIKHALESEYCLEGVRSSDLLIKTLEQTLSELSKELGEDMTQWEWQKKQKTVFKHTLFKKIPFLRSIANRSVNSNGSSNSLNRNHWNSKDKHANQFFGTNGAAVRMIASPKHGHAQFMMPMGCSGNPFSRYYANLLPMWVEGTYIDSSGTARSDYDLDLVLKPSV
ncbi:penicillin acylase family protein [Candidatus Comchoanobacter bicostacola]|uniref:Penicillin acylase family protein n=1 Tax=Candidatus Comchoanobacter bicostacola TaxID=2919598 RepID=A0ABY5DJS1_9GAMM|nr:penicillin acylase family protein [Candidatus Comchoanobacter bicostacola]UTC24768.1 penicillin acylase family protein [Candidatus Comchoanobacter bicostacola]